MNEPRIIQCYFCSRYFSRDTVRMTTVGNDLKSPDSSEVTICDGCLGAVNNGKGVEKK